MQQILSSSPAKAGDPVIAGLSNKTKAGVYWMMRRETGEE
jgi:hypothetical protein